MSASGSNPHSAGVDLRIEQQSARADSMRRLPRVQKDTDDPTHPPLASPGTENQQQTTFTTLTRLLGATSATPEPSRASSYMMQQQEASMYERNPDLMETVPLPDHLFTRGLLQGKHSDITVHAFGTEYKLHRIVLDRAPFFASALSGPWLEAKSSEMSVRPEEIDSNITKRGFELALKKLYSGMSELGDDDNLARELFATGCWLEMPELIETSIDSILKQITLETLGTTITLVVTNYYGRAGEKILASAKAMLCRDGWRMPIRCWDTIPTEVIKEIIASDGFYVASEWERWHLARRLLDRRLRAKANENHPALSSESVKAGADLSPEPRSEDNMRRHHTTAIYADPEIRPLLALLEDGVYYVHMDFEQLQRIRSATDTLGNALLPDTVLTDALWQQTLLRQRVVNAKEPDLELGFILPASSTSTLRNSTTTATGKSKTVSMDQQRPESDDSMRSKTRLYPVPSADCNIVMGGITDSTMPMLYGDAHSEPRVWPPTTDRIISGDTSNENLPPPIYSNMPPFRFSAEFPSPKALKDRKRVYSRTIFYAGSMWNIYIQKVASNARGTKQLGVYLHRAKEQLTEDTVFSSTGGDSIYNSRTAVESRIDLLEREMQGTRPAGHWSEESGSSNTTRQSTSLAAATNAPRRSSQGGRPSTGVSFTSPSDHEHDSSNDDEDEGDTTTDGTAQSDHVVPALPPYVDARATIRTYFKIYSPSRGGRMLSVYESAPDKFNFSQSWGWKSSTLMLDEGILPQDESEHVLKATGGRDTMDVSLDGVSNAASGIKYEGSGGRSVRPLDDGKLRFMVVIGVI